MECISSSRRKIEARSRHYKLGGTDYRNVTLRCSDPLCLDCFVLVEWTIFASKSLKASPENLDWFSKAAAIPICTYEYSS